jgi:hypothetical protein
MQQARRRVLGAAGDACATGMAGGSLSGHLLRTAQHLRCMALGTGPGNEAGVSQLCSLRGWAQSTAHDGAAPSTIQARGSCSNQQQRPAGYSKCLDHRYTGGEPHHKDDAGSHPISVGPLQGSLSAVALLAAAAPADMAAVDGFGPVVAAMQLIDGLHAATGLPWWATLSVTAVGEFPCGIPFRCLTMSRSCKLSSLPAAKTHTATSDVCRRAAGSAATDPAADAGRCRNPTVPAGRGVQQDEWLATNRERDVLPHVSLLFCTDLSSWAQCCDTSTWP